MNEDKEKPVLAQANDLGDICGLSARSIKRLAAQGILKPLPISARCTLYDVQASIDAIRKYAEQNAEVMAND